MVNTIQLYTIYIYIEHNGGIFTKGVEINNVYCDGTGMLFCVHGVCSSSGATTVGEGGGAWEPCPPFKPCPPPTMPPSPHLTFDCAPFIAMPYSWSLLDEGLHPLPPPPQPPNKDSVMPLYSDQVRRDNKGGTTCTGGYKGVRAVRPESVAGGG